MQNKTPTSTTELRNALLAEITKLQSGEITPERVNAISHASNVVLKSVALQIKYSAQRGERPEIPFVG